MIIDRKNIKFNVNESEQYQEFWSQGEWEYFTYNCIERFSNINKKFIDIGAWIGPISLYAASLNKQVYAVEPDKVAYLELAKNLSLNPNINNVFCQQVAIFNKNDTIRIGTEVPGNSNTRVNTDCILNSAQVPEYFYNVQCKTLSTFLEDNNIKGIDLSCIKIVVEGAEIDIILDPFFKDYLDIPVHLSIHTPLFKADTANENLNNIYKFCSLYKKYESERSSLCDLEAILKIDGFYSIMLFND
jgi:FkbM family methyltransferase